jgi:hypothetical protein
MKLFKSVHTYDYPWSLVSAANWQKYPNEHCSHVHAVDVLDRRVDPETGILITERLITVKQNVPFIILKVCFLAKYILKGIARINRAYIIVNSLWVLVIHNMFEKFLLLTPSRKH